MFHQGMGENPAERPLPLGNGVHRARERVEERIVQRLERLLDAVVLQVILAEQLHPGVVVRGQASRARIPRTDRGRHGAAGEASGLHRIDDAAPRERVDHVRRVARHQETVGIGLLDRRVHDDAPHRVAGPGAVGIAPVHPRVEILARVAAVALQRHQPQSHVGDPHALGKDPGIPTRRDGVTELQVDRVGVEIDPLDHVLGARFHVAGGHARVESRPATDHRLHAVRPDHDFRPIGRRTAQAAHGDVPAPVRGPRHPRRFRAHEQLGARRDRFGGEMGVEPRAIEDPAHVPLGDPDLRVVRRDEDDTRNLARDPRGAVRIGELAQPGVPDALRAAHRCSHRAIALEQHHVELRCRAFCLCRGDGTGRARADDQEIDVRHRPWRARQPGRARRTSGSRYRSGGRRAGR